MTKSISRKEEYEQNPKPCKKCGKNLSCRQAVYRKGDFCSTACSKFVKLKDLTLISEEVYLESPRLCELCNKVIQFNKLKKFRKQKYCGHSCAAKASNRDRIKVQLSNCSYCNRSCYGSFCGNLCKKMCNRKQKICDWLNGILVINSERLPDFIREYLIFCYSGKCQLCGKGPINQKTNKPAVTVHHIDGHATNNVNSNLELLCPTCHTLTPNFGSLNNGNGRKYKLKKWHENKN